jgi:cell division protein FtsB
VDDRRALPPTEPPEPDQAVADAPPSAAPDAPDPAEPAADALDLSALSVAGITRRRVAWVAAGLIAAWIVVMFARQASEGAAVAARAEQIARDNQALAAEVAALEHERQLIERPAYIDQQARAYRLGSPKEIPFALDPSVPTPGPDSPGSAATRVGGDAATTPLDTWLSLLFGPAD